MHRFLVLHTLRCKIEPQLRKRNVGSRGVRAAWLPRLIASPRLSVTTTRTLTRSHSFQKAYVYVFHATERKQNACSKPHTFGNDIGIRRLDTTQVSQKESASTFALNSDFPNHTTIPEHQKRRNPIYPPRKLPQPRFSDDLRQHNQPYLG